MKCSGVIQGFGGQKLILRPVKVYTDLNGLGLYKLYRSLREEGAVLHCLQSL